MTTAEPYRLLIVDDELTTRKLLRAAAMSNGMVCDLAVNGQQALSHLETNDYDAVVTDIHMPVVHGHALIVSLLEQPNRPMIVAVTAVEEPRIIKDLIYRGVDELEFKPLDYELFAIKLSALLDRKKLRTCPAI
ncbi:MAG: response regulator [Planctomycetaceae bacterium]|nr:response regulator [Planctomycetales bacterium]MCB9927489.1 response regulator [Planctomycetaceae bacterium]